MNKERASFMDTMRQIAVGAGIEGDIDWAEVNAMHKQINQDASDSTGGGSCNYYMAFVDNPTTLPEPYAVECNDLIESLGLTWQEANIYKEIFRTANERTHDNGKEGNTPKRAAEKVLFFAIRNAVKNGVDIHKMIEDVNCE